VTDRQASKSDGARALEERQLLPSHDKLTDALEAVLARSLERGRFVDYAHVSSSTAFLLVVRIERVPKSTSSSSGCGLEGYNYGNRARERQMLGSRRHLTNRRGHENLWVCL